MKWWERRKKEPPAPVVQVRQGAGHPFGLLDRYLPLQPGEVQLYRAIREGVPIVDAAIWKLVRLCGGVRAVSYTHLHSFHWANSAPMKVSFLPGWVSI